MDCLVLGSSLGFVVVNACSRFRVYGYSVFRVQALGSGCMVWASGLSGGLEL